MVAGGGPLDDLRLQRTSTADQVASLLRDRILRGELPPGTPLREVMLATSLGIARTTVREAIRRLEAEGLVHHRIHRGAVVTTLDPQDIREIFQIRREIEFLALRRLPHEQIPVLAGAARNMVARIAEGDPALLIAADMVFHQTLVDSLGNARLSAFFANTLAELRIALCLLETGGVPSWVPLHLEICDLLAEGDRRGAVRLLSAHFAETEALLCRTVSGTGGA